MTQSMKKNSREEAWAEIVAISGRLFRKALSEKVAYE